MDTIQINLAEFGGVIAALLVVGAILKNAFPNFPNRLIPLVTWLAGVLAYLTLTGGWTDGKQWIAAVIASATATGTHSGVKNTLSGTVPGGGVIPLLILSVALALSPGCSTPARTAYTVERSAAITAEAALGAWDSYVEQFHPPLAQEQAVSDAFGKYKAAQLALLDAAIFFTEYKDAPDAQAKMQAATSAAAAALADLISIARQFGAKL